MLGAKSEAESEVNMMEKDERDEKGQADLLMPSDEKQETVVEPKKETALLGFFNVILPTVDVVTDLMMIVKLFMKNHPKWASLLLGPFLLNYFLSWNFWWRMEKNKKLSWIAALFNCYPQWSAIKVIHAFWTNPQEAQKKKNTYLREGSEIEVFAESVLTVLAMTFLMVKGLADDDGGGLRKGQAGALIIGESYWDDETRSTHYSHDGYLFFFSYAISLLSASLGLAKTLKTGPCRTLAEGGALGGLCTGRFLLLTLSIGTTLVAKGLPMAWAFGGRGMSLVFGAYFPGVFGQVEKILSLVTMFGPGLLLALFSMCRYRQSLRDILCHPSLLLLPVFTFFTFRANRKDGQVRVAYSKNYTLSNLALSLAGYVTYAAVTAVSNTYHTDILLFSLPVPMASLLLTFLYLFLDSCCPCCPHSPALQESIMLPGDPLVEYVKIRVGGEKVLIPMQQK